MKALFNCSVIKNDICDLICLLSNHLGTIMKPCADWFCQYCEWEDNNIINDNLSHNN